MFAKINVILIKRIGGSRRVLTSYKIEEEGTKIAITYHKVEPHLDQPSNGLERLGHKKQELLDQNRDKNEPPTAKAFLLALGGVNEVSVLYVTGK